MRVLRNSHKQTKHRSILIKTSIKRYFEVRFMAKQSVGKFWVKSDDLQKKSSRCRSQLIPNPILNGNCDCLSSSKILKRLEQSRY